MWVWVRVRVRVRVRVQVRFSARLWDVDVRGRRGGELRSVVIFCLCPGVQVWS